jgi:hypothetical protein
MFTARHFVHRCCMILNGPLWRPASAVTRPKATAAWRWPPHLVLWLRMNGATPPIHLTTHLPTAFLVRAWPGLSNQQDAYASTSQWLLQIMAQWRRCPPSPPLTVRTNGPVMTCKCTNPRSTLDAFHIKHDCVVRRIKVPLPAGAENFLFTTGCRQAPGPTQPVQCVPTILSQRAKRQLHGAD